MGETIKICAMAVMIVLVALPLKEEKAHMGLLICMAMGILILNIALRRVGKVLESLELLKDYLGSGGGYLGLLLKVLGITYVCEFASSICKDAGYGFVAGQLEVLGKLSVMVSGISILFALIDQIKILA